MYMYVIFVFYIEFFFHIISCIKRQVQFKDILKLGVINYLFLMVSIYFQTQI